MSQLTWTRNNAGMWIGSNEQTKHDYCANKRNDGYVDLFYGTEKINQKRLRLGIAKAAAQLHHDAHKDTIEDATNPVVDPAVVDDILAEDRGVMCCRPDLPFSGVDCPDCPNQNPPKVFTNSAGEPFDPQPVIPILREYKEGDQFAFIAANNIERTVLEPMIVKDARVKFIGPEYENAYGPCIGQEGTVTEKSGYTAQRAGHPREELVTVRFNSMDKPVVVSIKRVEPIIPPATMPKSEWIGESPFKSTGSFEGDARVRSRIMPSAERRTQPERTVQVNEPCNWMFLGAVLAFIFVNELVESDGCMRQAAQAVYDACRTKGERRKARKAFRKNGWTGLASAA